VKASFDSGMIRDSRTLRARATVRECWRIFGDPLKTIPHIF